MGYLTALCLSFLIYKIGLLGGLNKLIIGLKHVEHESSLVDQGLGLGAFNAQGPGRGTKIPWAAWPKNKNKKLHVKIQTI